MPLAATGLCVDGVEQSAAMIARLRAKPGGDSVTVTQGDIADGIRVSPIVTRFAWPSEMDLMARLAGLRLHARWGGVAA